MIDEEFLKELGLDDELVESILTRDGEERKIREAEALKNEIKAFGVYDEELILWLLERDGLESGELSDKTEKIEALKENYPFLFKNTDMPQIVSPILQHESIGSEEFGRMGYKARNELYRKNPRLYKKLANI